MPSYHRNLKFFFKTLHSLWPSPSPSPSVSIFRSLTQCLCRIQELLSSRKVIDSAGARSLVRSLLEALGLHLLAICCEQTCQCNLSALKLEKLSRTHQEHGARTRRLSVCLAGRQDNGISIAGAQERNLPPNQLIISLRPAQHQPQPQPQPSTLRCNKAKQKKERESRGNKKPREKQKTKKNQQIISTKMRLKEK